ncbi:Zinc finger FYVE domain-containing protein 21 [Rhynchospora pubera]|uniref:Zinc finger FYVE domain-containing protein 21 n=1 Tax=Rhynchospora pubera TaxID=906938 RepID=A0AAV8E3I8_9POAL|nr:Zinc finger FYVE domain-containing protein 21 [Rhynchospora pubera]
MNQGSEYTSASSHYYSQPNPNPNPYSTSNPIPSPYASASAPPYSAYSAPEYPTYTPYPPTQDPIPNPNPYSQLPSQPQPQSQSQYNYSSYSSPSYHANPNENPSPYPSYENSYSSNSYDQGGIYYSDNSYQDFYGKKPEPVQTDEGLNEGVYAYDGGRSEPYGARGTVPTRSPMLFDDYGRSIGFSDGSGAGVGAAPGSGPKIVKAVPKMDAKDDVKNGVQKFRVKLLAEGAGSAMDVLCQIGLDGIRMLDPSSNRMLRIYPLENVTRWEVVDSSIFAFWSKTAVDYEPKRIRLQSNSYTARTLLDTVTAATVQFKEMGGSSFTKAKVDASKLSEQQPGKKGFDWMNLIKIPNEEKDHWVPDEAVKKCTSCGGDFNAFNRRHHCRNCGDIFCDKCSQGRIALTAEENAQPVRVCDRCMAEVSHRLSTAIEAGNKPALQSHEDLARKLQEELERNRKSSSGSKSNGSGGLMREVACPVCTVHLQVQVPTSGSETIECGVCQHPFLVSAD